MIRLTAEDFRAAASANKRFMNRFRAKIRNLTYVMMGGIGAFAVGLGVARLMTLFDKPGTVGAVIAFVGAAVGAAAFLYLKKYSEEVALSHDHHKSSQFLTKVYTAIQDNPFSFETDKLINDYLALEKDSRARALMRHELVDMRSVAGDFDGAYRALFNDAELFAQDKYFELVYYNGLVNYYVNCGSTTGGTEYAEDSYRNLERAYNEFDPGKKDFMALDILADGQMMMLFYRGEWQECLDLLDAMHEAVEEGTQVRKTSPLHQINSALRKLRMAECLYHLGKYDEALKLCDEAGPKLKRIGYQLERANRLSAQIHSALGQQPDA